MRFIEIIGSRFKAIIDDEDYDSVISFSPNGWRLRVDLTRPNHVSIESVKSLGTRFGDKFPVLLSRFVLGLHKCSTPSVDHKHGDIFDNRKGFLRKCTVAQNNSNRGIQVNNTSGYKGVSWSVAHRKFSAKISCDKKVHRIGWFKTAKEAALAYDIKAKELHGEFAVLNGV